MSLTREKKVVAAAFAAANTTSNNTPEANFFSITNFMAFATLLGVQERATLRIELEQFKVPQLLRALSLCKVSHQAPLTRFQVEMDLDGNWLCNGEIIGRQWLLYKTVQPYETQSRVAYDLFFQTIFATLARQQHITVLRETDYYVEMFVPVQFQGGFDELWDMLVAELFSERNLRQTFVSLMKSVKLANRGFSALDMPILTEDQALILAGFDLVNLHSLMDGDNSRRRKIHFLEQRLTEPDLDEKDRKVLHKRLSELTKELQTRVARYTPMYEQWELLKRETPEWTDAVCRAERYYQTKAEQPLAGQQIAKAGAKIRKAVKQISDLQNLVAERQYATLAPLLSSSSIPASLLPGGDSNTKVCYGCGRAIPKGDPVYQANTFIFAAPSQRVQSGGSQKQPNICGTCAAVAFISPIKLGEGRLVLRLRRSEEDGFSTYMGDEQLKMFALGDLNIVAGRYAMLQTPETVSGKLMIDKLGGVQYALYKIASIFTSPTVFQEYVPEVIIGETPVLLPQRHVIWMQQLIAIFPLKRKWADKSQFNSFGRSIRHVQQDKLIFAVYELLRAGMTSGRRLSLIQSIQLENLYKSHWEELMKVDPEKAQFYKDVAAMTGLHYAFCRYIYSKTSGNEQRIEVRKAIERIDDPFQFNYTEANITESKSALLRYQADIYFIYAQTAALLTELGIDLVERQAFTPELRGKLKLSPDAEVIQIYIDDVLNAHTYLTEGRYNTAKAQREFFYALKLSLHARFPELMERKKENE